MENMTHFHGGRSASLVSLGSLVGVAALGVRECKKTSIVVYFSFFNDLATGWKINTVLEKRSNKISIIIAFMEENLRALDPWVV
jgi:hypothetical protein